MLIRFFIYGLMGWIIEVAFTGTGSALRGSLSLTGHTYLWMLPIYGMAVFFEPVHDHIRETPWPIRGIIWASLILFVEYISGLMLTSMIGFCPWDYTDHTRHSINGFIRLDFFPFWFAAGFLFEIFHDFLNFLSASIKSYRKQLITNKQDRINQ